MVQAEISMFEDTDLEEKLLKLFDKYGCRIMKKNADWECYNFHIYYKIIPCDKHDNIGVWFSMYYENNFHNPHYYTDVIIKYGEYWMHKFDIKTLGKTEEDIFEHIEDALLKAMQWSSEAQT